MNASRRTIRVLLRAALAFTAAFASLALGQQPQRATPRLGFVYPAGGQRGTTFTVTLGGQNLREPEAAFFSTPGVHARVLGYQRPMSQKEINELREQLDTLRARRDAAHPELRGRSKDPSTQSAPLSPTPGWSEADEQRFRELWTKFARRPKPNANPSLAETATLEVTLPADAPLGDCALRLKSAAGLSNPLTFQIGDLPEVTGSVVTVANPPTASPRRNEGRATTTTASPPTAVTLPCLINGQIMPGEVDRFRFAARAGQRITVRASARALIPYLADAVPGWFQATLALHDAAGRELAYDDDFRFNPDPVLSFPIPADGDYTIEIKDAIFRGREDFVYRIAIGELPFITSVFPLGVAPGQPASVALQGWNLPSNRLAVPPAGSTTSQPVSVQRDGHQSNIVEIDVDRRPTVLDREPNDARERAQFVDWPVVIDGRIDQPGDVDLFEFEARQGMTVVAEVLARRLNSPLDASLVLTDSAGQTLAANDDHEDPRAGLTTHHADPRLSFTFTEPGRYQLRLHDAQRQGGDEYGYRLSIGPPRPDFELRVVPASINATAGGHVPLTVYALRRDGFSGEIELALTGTPLGFSLAGARIPPGEDRVQVTLRAADAQREPISIGLRGRATIDGAPVERRAVPAEDLMQAFAYHHLVPQPDLLVSIGRRALPCRVLSEQPLRIPPDGLVHVRLALGPAVTDRPRAPARATARPLTALLAERGFENLQVELFQPPPGVTGDQIIPHDDEVELVLRVTSLKPGAEGNLIFELFADRLPPKDKPGARRQPHVSIGFSPALPFSVGPTPSSTSRR